MRLIGAVLLLGLAVGARAEGQEVTRNRNVVEFENGSIELVRLYLVDRGSIWLLGRADPGRVTLLPLPPGFTRRDAGQILLVAVPLGAPGGREARLGTILETPIAAMESQLEAAGSVASTNSKRCTGSATTRGFKPTSRAKVTRSTSHELTSPSSSVACLADRWNTSVSSLATSRSFCVTRRSSSPKGCCSNSARICSLFSGLHLRNSSSRTSRCSGVCPSPSSRFSSSLRCRSATLASSPTGSLRNLSIRS